jgi:S-adenosylmethionine/arginine decarboxylase-like enzyme
MLRRFELFALLLLLFTNTFAQTVNESTDIGVQSTHLVSENRITFQTFPEYFDYYGG